MSVTTLYAQYCRKLALDVEEHKTSPTTTKPPYSRISAQKYSAIVSINNKQTDVEEATHGPQTKHKQKYYPHTPMYQSPNTRPLVPSVNETQYAAPLVDYRRERGMPQRPGQTSASAAKQKGTSIQQ